mgnify:CR=1 FL=1
MFRAQKKNILPPKNLERSLNIFLKIEKKNSGHVVEDSAFADEPRSKYIDFFF